MKTIKAKARALRVDDLMLFVSEFFIAACAITFLTF
jgi:hypothetical protein